MGSVCVCEAILLWYLIVCSQGCLFGVCVSSFLSLSEAGQTNCLLGEVSFVAVCEEHIHLLSEDVFSHQLHHTQPCSTRVLYGTDNLAGTSVN